MTDGEVITLFFVICTLGGLLWQTHILRQWCNYNSEQIGKIFDMLGFHVESAIVRQEQLENRLKKLEEKHEDRMR